MHRATTSRVMREIVGAAGTLFLTFTAANAQTPSATVPKPPLPKIDLKFNALTSELDAQGLTRIRATGGATLTYGDLRIQADNITYTRDGLFIEATGNVFVVRGDESLRGERFTFYGTDGAADAGRTTIISPPFYIASDRLIRGVNGTLIQNGRIVSSPDGQGEVSISAREIQLQSDKNRAILRDMTIRLFGTRLLTVRHARIPISLTGREDEQEQNRASLPLTFRVSGIAGAAVGLKLPILIDDKTNGEYGVEFTQRTAPQSFLRVRRDLIAPDSIGRERTQSTLFTLPGGMGNESYEGISPLRQLAIARPLPPVPDPILDYESILLSPDAVERPVRSLNRHLFVEVNASGNRDINSKRQGPILLSRLPEARINGSFPLISRVPHSASNASLRRFLQRPHLQITGNGSVGRYREQRIQNDGQTISSGRTALSVGVGMLPLLIGEHILLRPQVTAHSFRYDTQGSPAYRFVESSVTLDYIFYARTMLGGSYIRRDQSGTTPFIFDQVDTRDEGQIRGQVALPGGKFTLASQIRYDLKQSRLFDTEIALAWRGKSIEPRISYRTQNSQIGFGVTLPGFGSGWHLIEIRMRNGAGGAGPWSRNGFGANFGLGYKDGIGGL
ncbi:MAG: hypothetical protein V4671_25965, partial [Armatimonadota bacterium]